VSSPCSSARLSTGHDPDQQTPHRALAAIHTSCLHRFPFLEKPATMRRRCAPCPLLRTERLSDSCAPVRTVDTPLCFRGARAGMDKPSLDRRRGPWRARLGERLERLCGRAGVGVLWRLRCDRCRATATCDRVVSADRPADLPPPRSNRPGRRGSGADFSAPHRGGGCCGLKLHLDQPPVRRCTGG
jgi:hypothetical protein